MEYTPKEDKSGSTERSAVAIVDTGYEQLHYDIVDFDTSSDGSRYLLWTSRDGSGIDVRAPVSRTVIDSTDDHIDDDGDNDPVVSDAHAEIIDDDVADEKSLVADGGVPQ